MSKEVDGFKIEKGIPIPPKRGFGIAGVLRQMKVGDSVVFSLSARSSVHQAARNVGIKVTQRQTEEGLRVWRVK